MIKSGPCVARIELRASNKLEGSTRGPSLKNTVRCSVGTGWGDNP